MEANKQRQSNPWDYSSEEEDEDVGKTGRSTAWQLRRAGEEAPLASMEGPRLATRPFRFGSDVLSLFPPDEEEEDEMLRSQGSLEEGEWSDLTLLLDGR